jgi:hypothetical protein
MSKFAVLDAHGRATGLYDSATGIAIPEGAVAITNAQFAAIMSDPKTTTIVGSALGNFADAFVPPALSVRALLALSNGLNVTSTGEASALNGTYALDTTTVSLAADLAALIAANGGAFPASASNWSWPDASGALHVFGSASTFVAFYQALSAYRLALFAVVWGAASELPEAAAVIP